MAGQTTTHDQHHFDRGAWLMLAIAVTMLLLSLGFLIYRFTLPTDGWYVTSPVGLDSVGFIYTENLIGVSSGLQPGDHLIAVNGSSLARDLPQSLVDSWRAGQTMRYTVVRAGQELTLAVPLVHWRPGLWLTTPKRTAHQRLFDQIQHNHASCPRRRYLSTLMGSLYILMIQTIWRARLQTNRGRAPKELIMNDRFTTLPPLSDRSGVTDAVRAQILATEHWSLLATRSMTWNEIFSRASMFVTVLPGEMGER
jgi:hypothetical protein